MSFAHYLLQVNLYLIVFYACYKLLLDKETYFILNRIYLVSAGVLSATIPVIRLEWITQQETAQKVYTSVNWDTVLQQATIVSDDQSGLNWANAFVFIYCAGILFFLGRLVFNLFAVKKLIRSAKSGSAFSFFQQKVIDADLPLAPVIDVHEDAHVKQWHTADILFFEVLGILTWINPVIYLYKKSIKNIHEYLADEHAAAYQGDKAEYAMLILSQSLGISPNSLTNGFFDKSLIKKRIFMLQKEKSKKTAIIKYGVFIPLFAILIVFSSATIRKNENLIAISDEIPLEQPLEMVQAFVKKTDVTNHLAVQTLIGPSTAKLEGDWTSFYRFLAKTISYPSEAQRNNIQGNTQVKFILQNNKIRSVATVRELGEGCDEEVMRAVLSYKGFKNLPNGKYTFKVGFRRSESPLNLKNAKVISIPNYQRLSDITVIGNSVPKLNLENSEKIFDFVSIDKQPEYPGGIAKFYEYLGKSIKYPKMAVNNKVSGKVFLTFIVERDGKLSDVKITRGLGSGTDEEALRVIRDSPNWNPGVTQGKTVRVRYNINVNFTLNPSSEKAKTDPEVKTGMQQTKVPAMGSGVATTLDGFKGILIIDGVKTDKNALNAINSNDIESVTVLKDNAATSLYGLTAKEGVLLVTTKMVKGSAFRKPQQAELTIEKKSAYDYLRTKF